MLKKAIIHIRTSARFIILFSVAIILIIGIIFTMYKPTYSVNLNGKFIGYCENKSNLQSRISNYIQNGDSQNVAFVEVEQMPEYNLCLLKKDITTNEEDIYNQVVTSGTTYYKMYALVENGEEKMYVSNFAEAENVVNQLKEKNSSNKESISIAEKYETECKEFTSVEECVNSLYKEEQTVKLASTKNTTSTKVATSSKTTSSSTSKTKVANLGISLITPTTGTITSRFGIRARDNHKGIDIGAPKGTPIKAAASGTVIHSGNKNDGYGKYIILSHENGVQTYYAHCSELLVSKGEQVKQGQVIAKVGSTGISTGNHLHFEVRKNGVAQNPQNYVYK